ncbi:hypothetical protein [Humidesulfovibrio idahonensis]
MKRWFPIFFLSLSLLANIIVHIRYVHYLEMWSPLADYSSPQPLGLFALVSVPLCLFIFWRNWRPDAEHLRMIHAARRRIGNALLFTSITVWIYFRMQSIVSAWIAATPTPDPLHWLWLSSRQSNTSTLSLILAGLLALWLKGIRMPPPEPRE